MGKNSQDFSMQEVLRLANTPAGQQLLAILRQADPTVLRQLQDKLSSGDPAQAAQSLQLLLSTGQLQSLLELMRGQAHG